MGAAEGWRASVLAERAHQKERSDPGQSLCSLKAAHQTNRIIS